MSIPHGKDAAVYLADSGGTQRNLSSFCDGVETSWEREANETTTFGATARRRTGGLQDNSFSLSGKWDNGGTATPDQWLIGLEQAAGTVSSAFVIAPNGSASGRPYYSGAAFITSYTTSTPFDDIVTWGADFEVDGAVTRGTF